ncbi:putative oxidoreductase [Baekduia alba]|uniref:SDR family oxidoreductase n=1 Tax=Baekduia alba TaxID=2997333 RepID=UPI0023405100|nr:SDR family NAD(P)-dependent oxidoreductase [Baekduia alba]WCB95951.1 putative oxidoreductase [Baekduia alba]
MDIDLSGQVVAITGASSGIGEATALAAATAGAAVSLAARRTDRIEALANVINNQGGRAVAVTTDVSDEAQAKAFINTTLTELGGLDALVNNAGIMLLGPVAGANTDEWRTMVDVNLYGVIYTTHAAVDQLVAQGSGHIVTVSSIAGVRASAGSAVYNATKFAVNAFSEALRQELAEHDVRVTTINPGAVETELRTHLSAEQQQAQRERFAGVAQLQAEDIANIILYALGQPAHVSLNDILVRPTRQQR